MQPAGRKYDPRPATPPPAVTRRTHRLQTRLWLHLVVRSCIAIDRPQISNTITAIRSPSASRDLRNPSAVGARSPLRLRPARAVHQERHASAGSSDSRTASMSSRTGLALRQHFKKFAIRRRRRRAGVQSTRLRPHQRLLDLVETAHQSSFAIRRSIRVPSFLNAP